MIPKLKAWDKINERIVEVSEIHFWTKIIDTTDTFLAFSNIELLQSTGLFDKNGKEIFESDIVRNNYGELGHIKWSRGGFVYHEDGANFYLFSIGAGQPFEILGNIYEHPHLLEEE